MNARLRCLTAAPHSEGSSARHVCMQLHTSHPLLRLLPSTVVLAHYTLAPSTNMHMYMLTQIHGCIHHHTSNHLSPYPTPQTGEALFERMTEQKIRTRCVSLELTLSAVEVFNNNVRDLLGPSTAASVREPVGVHMDQAQIPAETCSNKDTHQPTRICTHTCIPTSRCLPPAECKYPRVAVRQHIRESYHIERG